MPNAQMLPSKEIWISLHHWKVIAVSFLILLFVVSTKPEQYSNSPCSVPPPPAHFEILNLKHLNAIQWGADVVFRISNLFISSHRLFHTCL